MKNSNLFLSIIVICFLFIQCKTETQKSQSISAGNTVKYAKGFSIENYDGFSIVTVKNPWPKATKTYTYILKEKNGIVPDSLSQNPIINVPI